MEVKAVDIRTGTYLRPVERRLFWEVEELGLADREEDEITVVASDFSEEAEVGLPVYRRPWFIVLVIVLVSVAIGVAVGCGVAFGGR